LKNALCRLREKLSTQKKAGDGTFSDIFSTVARLARVIAVNTPHHVTQRGNARQSILASDTDRTVYLDLLRNYA
jgi:hypothetical protein